MYSSLQRVSCIIRIKKYKSVSGVLQYLFTDLKHIIHVAWILVKIRFRLYNFSARVNLLKIIIINIKHVAYSNINIKTAFTTMKVNYNPTNRCLPSN